MQQHVAEDEPLLVGRLSRFDGRALRIRRFRANGAGPSRKQDLETCNSGFGLKLKS
jgi:hypothetical protein